MNHTVPGAKNWPETRTEKQLKIRRSGLREIDRGTDNDAEGKLVRLSRRFSKEEDGKLIAYVGAFMCRRADGTMYVLNSAWGRVGLDQQMMMAARLQDYLLG